MTLNRAECTILLIDDEPAGLKLRGRVLESIGYNVLCAETGAEGLALFQSHDVDVVVTDHLAGSAFGLASSLDAELFLVHAALAVGQRVAVEAGGDLLRQRGPRQPQRSRPEGAHWRHRPDRGQDGAPHTPRPLREGETCPPAH